MAEGMVGGGKLHVGERWVAHTHIHEKSLYSVNCKQDDSRKSTPKTRCKNQRTVDGDTVTGCFA